MTDTRYFRIYYLSESALSIEFGDTINEHISLSVNQFKRVLDSFPFSGYITSVQGYTTLTVIYDPLEVLRNSTLTGETCFDKLGGYLMQLKDKVSLDHHTAINKVRIPVCYDTEYGPDLSELADMHRMSIEQLVELHTQAVYKVYMIGFVPGFAYLGGLDARLNSPRRSFPRQSVPSGSVGIAGMQTGVYPLETPGGWQLIGRTPVKLFDPNRTRPSMLKAGDEVEFYPIGKQEFIDYSHADPHS